MHTKTIYTDEELGIVDAVENNEYISLPKDEFEQLKQYYKTIASETIKQRADDKHTVEDERATLKTILS